jgi:hypothetical protein
MAIVKAMGNLQIDFADPLRAVCANPPAQTSTHLPKVFRASLVLGNQRAPQPGLHPREFPASDRQGGGYAPSAGSLSTTTVPRMMPGSCLHCLVLPRSRACSLRTYPVSSEGSGLTMVCRPALAAQGSTSSTIQPPSEYSRELGGLDPRLDWRV